MSLESLCQESVTPEVRSTAAASTTNAGTHSDTFTAGTAILMSRPQPASGGTVMEAMRRNVVVSHTFYCATDPALLTGDRLAYGGLKYLVQWQSDEGGQGRAYAVHTKLHAS